MKTPPNHTCIKQTSINDSFDHTYHFNPVLSRPNQSKRLKQSHDNNVHQQ